MEEITYIYNWEREKNGMAGKIFEFSKSCRDYEKSILFICKISNDLFLFYCVLIYTNLAEELFFSH